MKGTIECQKNMDGNKEHFPFNFLPLTFNLLPLTVYFELFAKQNKGGNMKKYLFIILAALLIVGGCSKKKENTKTQKTSTSSFTPPADGKITKDLADKYVAVSRALNKAVFEQSKKIEAFRKRYKLSEDMTELLDSTYIKTHPVVVKEWNSLNKEWEKKQDEIYKSIGMSEDEFNWVAGALINKNNADMQAYISKAFSEKETKSKTTKNK